MDTNEDTITIDRPVVGTASSLLVAEPEEGNDTEQVISLAVNGETASSLLVAEPEEGNDTEQVISLAVNGETASSLLVAEPEEGNSAEEICSLDANEELEESMSDTEMMLKHLGSFFSYLGDTNDTLSSRRPTRSYCIDNHTCRFCMGVWDFIIGWAIY